YRGGTQQRYHVPCRSCGGFQPLEWENFKAVIEAEGAGSAHFVCEHCGEPIGHADKEWMVQRGEGVARNPSGAYPSFHLWAAYSPLESWQAIAQRWLDAKGDPAAEQAVLNDDAGLPYAQAGEAPKWEELKTRADKTGHVIRVVPVGGLILVGS